MSGSHRLTTAGVLIRSWRPEDKTGLERVGDRLSRTALAGRFYGGTSRVPADYLHAIDEWWPTRWNAAVALRDGVLIGWSEYSLDRDDPHQAEIGVCVADTEQGLGVGTALVGAVVDLCMARGITTIRAVVNDDNPAVLRLYQKLTMRSGEAGVANRPVTCVVTVEASGFNLAAPMTSLAIRTADDTHSVRRSSPPNGDSTKTELDRGSIGEHHESTANPDRRCQRPNGRTDSSPLIATGA
ncbi:N-acetyltransferase family protein [Mycobacterium sp. URHB0021]|jgi:RimJ/RimL family protein N-acetyltransferase